MISLDEARMTHTTEALMLQYYLYRENDRIYTAFSKDFGRIQLIARGTNRITSKLAGHAEPGVLSHLMIAKGAGLDVMAQANTIDPFLNVRSDMEKWSAALVVLEGLATLATPYEPDPKSFYLAIQTLKIIEAQSSMENYIAAVYHYLLRFLVIVGYAHDVEDEAMLKNLLVADVGQDAILVEDRARGLIMKYLTHALDGGRLLCLKALHD